MSPAVEDTPRKARRLKTVPDLSEIGLRNGVAGPNFLLIGGQRCGTTWLSEMIRQHPDVFAPATKELHFFDKKSNLKKGLQWYREQFAGYQGQKAIGEFTPNYLWVCPVENEIQDGDHYWDIPSLVREHYPRIKLLVSLRDPVQRAISAYYHHMHRRRYAPTRRIMEVGYRYGIISMGFYYAHLTKWFEFFPPEQFLILIYEQDIAQNSEQTTRRVYRFLEVDESFRPTNMDRRYYARYGSLYIYLNYYFPKLTRFLVRIIPAVRYVNFPEITVTEAEIEELSKIYVDQNRRLEALLGQSLPWMWP